MKRLALITVFLAATLTSGCQQPVPEVDTQPPVLTVAVAGGRGDNIFSSADQPWPDTEGCIKVQGSPVGLSIGATDNGGISRLTLSVFGGTFDPDSIDVAPPGPESSPTVIPGSSGEVLLITLSPPSPGTARTSVVANVQVVPSVMPPLLGIRGTVTDTGGNVTRLDVFEVRALDDAVICRGER